MHNKILFSTRSIGDRPSVPNQLCLAGKDARAGQETLPAKRSLSSIKKKQKSPLAAGTTMCFFFFVMQKIPQCSPLIYFKF